ncbi:MAG: hypothetical protein ACRDK5_08365 [Solirubrobacterales bacterium]
MDKAGAVHRLDRCPHRLGEMFDMSGEAAKTICVRWRGAEVDRLARLIEQAEVETLAAEIQSRVQHRVGLPSSLEDARSMPPREALLHRIPYHADPVATRRSPRQCFPTGLAVLAAVALPRVATGCDRSALSEEGRLVKSSAG